MLFNLNNGKNQSKQISRYWVVLFVAHTTHQYTIHTPHTQRQQTRAGSCTIGCCDTFFALTQPLTAFTVLFCAHPRTWDVLYKIKSVQLQALFFGPETKSDCFFHYTKRFHEDRTTNFKRSSHSSPQQR